MDVTAGESGAGCRFGLPDGELARHLDDAVAQIAPWLVAMRREFHRQPELGWREFRTTLRIADLLLDMGYDVTAGHDMLGDVPRHGLAVPAVEGEGDTGCIAIYDTDRPGPTVCLRVDIDALPIREAASGHRPAAGGWASESEGAMHACGHDGHIAIGLGVARVLRPLLDTACGRLIVLFQPAEEGGRGARSVVEAGWMKGVDLFLAVHIGLGVPSGAVAIGVRDFLATRKFRVTLAGRPAHAGKAPQEGRNALLAACQTALGLHALAQSSEPNVRVNVGTLNAGTSLNIVPADASMEFEIRAGAMPALETLEVRCRQMVAATADAYGVGAAIELRGEAASWENGPGIVAWAEAVNRTVAAFPHVLDQHSFGASEDATLLAREVADSGGCAGIFVLGADLADGHHTPYFDFDEEVLGDGVKLLSAMIAAALSIDLARSVTDVTA